MEHTNDLGFRNLEVTTFRNRLTAHAYEENTNDLGHRDFRFRNLEVTDSDKARNEVSHDVGQRNLEVTVSAQRETRHQGALR